MPENKRAGNHLMLRRLNRLVNSLRLIMYILNNTSLSCARSSEKCEMVNSLIKNHNQRKTADMISYCLSIGKSGRRNNRSRQPNLIIIID